MKIKILKKEINLMKRHFGSHTEVALEIGIDPRYYRRIRNSRGRIVSRLMGHRIGQLLSECKPKNLIL